MNKTVLITGASGNLGHAVLTGFMEKGYRVAALESPRSASKLPESENLKSYPADLLDEREVIKVVDKVFTDFGGVDIAVFTVGGFAAGSITGTETDDFNKMYRLNFLTAYTIARQIYKRMAERGGGGQLVFIGSRPSLHPEQAKDMIAYSLSKSLLIRLTEVINEDGRGKNIHASVVIPGTLDTPQNRSAMPDADFSNWIAPSKVAEKICYLTTPEGREKFKSIIKI